MVIAPSLMVVGTKPSDSTTIPASNAAQLGTNGQRHIINKTQKITNAIGL